MLYGSLVAGFIVPSWVLGNILFSTCALQLCHGFRRVGPIEMDQFPPNLKVCHYYRGIFVYLWVSINISMNVAQSLICRESTRASRWPNWVYMFESSQVEAFKELAVHSSRCSMPELFSEESLNLETQQDTIPHIQQTQSSMVCDTSAYISDAIWVFGLDGVGIWPWLKNKCVSCNSSSKL